MSWLSDRASDLINGFGNIMGTMSEYSIPGLAMKAAGVSNPVENFYQNEFVNKSDLRGAEAVAFARGLPIIGNLVGGIEGVNQLEDLYNNTGKIPAYPGASNSGAANLGKAAGSMVRKIEDGAHDLAEYYSGEKLGPMPVEGKDYVTGDNFVNQ